MESEDTRTADTRAWLAKTRQDLRRVEILLAATPADVEGGLFHSQQAAEKALKAFLTWHDVRFRRIHDLEEIGKQCAQVDLTLGSLMGRAETLSEYASRFRYPGALYEPSLEEGQAALALAREVTEAILSRLPGEVRA
ncbi:MAG: HEPN domain-containing protein [Bryobacteraceae bacterium]|jgi:HEPN domain-containing protein